MEYREIIIPIGRRGTDSDKPEEFKRMMLPWVCPEHNMKRGEPRERTNDHGIKYHSWVNSCSCGDDYEDVFQEYKRFIGNMGSSRT